MSILAFHSVQFRRSVVSDSLRPHGPQHVRPPCPSPNPTVYPNPCPSSWWCHPTISSSFIPFSSCPQSFPALGSFQKSLGLAPAAKSLQLCLTLCDSIGGNPPGSPIPGILQARTLEWVAISFSKAWKWKVKVKSLSRAQLLATLCTAAYQSSLPMGFSRQEYWSCHCLLW